MDIWSSLQIIEITYIFKMWKIVSQLVVLEKFFNKFFKSKYICISLSLDNDSKSLKYLTYFND